MRRAHRERHAHDAVHSVVSRGLAPLLRFSPFVLWAPPILSFHIVNVVWLLPMATPVLPRVKPTNRPKIGVSLSVPWETC